MTLVQAVTSLVLNADPINVDMNAGKVIIHKLRGEGKAPLVPFHGITSLYSYIF